MTKYIYNLKVFAVISSKERISSIDVFRSIAIISVVLFHFGYLPFGHLGVDLFFVISGLLIGGILTKHFVLEIPVNFFKFVLQRGFKIWPSYYFFLFFGTIIAHIFYSSIDSNQIIPFWDIKRYVLFYQNYTGLPAHWSFDHVWSICVEEHFYILLPILFIFIQFFIKTKNRKIVLITSIVITIFFGILFKYLALKYTTGKDTYAATHNRIDALAWGVLLNFIIIFKGQLLKKIKKKYFIFIIGVLIFSASIYFYNFTNSEIYSKVFLHSIIPFSFFLMVLGLYYYDFSKLKLLRFIAYYSYNWYLWHPIFVIFIQHYFGINIFSLSLYIIVSLTMAMISTIFVEENFLKKRDVVLAQLNLVFAKTNFKIKN